MPKVISPSASSLHAYAVMRGNKSLDTSPEKQFQKALWRQGLKGYVKHYSGLIGHPDIVFRKSKVAIFINGCFWHKCPRCKIKYPVTNPEYWHEKIDGNVRRDKKIIRDLRRMDWRVLVFWECQIKKNIDRYVKQVDMILSRSRA